MELKKKQQQQQQKNGNKKGIFFFFVSYFKSKHNVRGGGTKLITVDITSCSSNPETETKKKKDTESRD